MIKTKYWIKDFNKIKESDWILKLLSVDNTGRNFKQLAQGNNISEVFISDELLYRHITTDINSIIEQDSISLIAELIHLKEKTKDEQVYLEEFKNKIKQSTFKDMFRGVDIPNLIFNNYGFIKNDHPKLESTQVQFFNKEIIKNLSNASDFIEGTKESKALKQSIKSATGWPVIDYKKHAIGSMVNILELTLDLIICQGADDNSKEKSVEFLVDIFGLYDDGIKKFIEDSFYKTSDYVLIPVWKGTAKEISTDTLKMKEDADDESFSNKLNKYLNYTGLNKSGYSETLVLVLYNLLIHAILKIEGVCNTLQSRVNYNDNKEHYIMIEAIQESIIALKEMINFQIKAFFGLTGEIKQMIDQKLAPPLDYSEGEVNLMFRIIGGVGSVIKKENCNRSRYPIVLDSTGTKGTVKINRVETLNRLIKMFMNPSTISMGGFVLRRSLMPKNCLILHRYIDKIIKSKINAAKRLDTEFNKMIKSIRLSHIKSLSTHIQAKYKKIMKEHNILLKKAVFNEISDDLLLKYDEYKERELYIVKEIIENNKYIKTGEKRNTKTLKELVLIQKKLIIEYFTVQNKSFVYSLLLENIYKALQDSLSEKNVNVSRELPTSFIKIIISKIKAIDDRITSSKRTLNTRNINNLAQKVKRGESIRLDMGGGEGLFDWVKINDTVGDDTVDKKKRQASYNKYLKKIIENKNLSDSEKSLLIKKLFAKKSGLKTTTKSKSKTKTKKSKPIIRPLNKLKTDGRLVIHNTVLNVEFWQDIEENLSGKKIFMPFYAPKKMMSYKGLFDIFYPPFEGQLNKESKYILPLSKSTLLNKLPHDGFMLVCSETSDLENINSWRLLKKSFIQDLDNQSASYIRKKIYSILKSETQYIKNTYVWKNSILKEDKLLIQSICKMYHDKLSGCQIIISREELLNYI
jgi:hypothetical protein